MSDRKVWVLKISILPLYFSKVGVFFPKFGILVLFSACAVTLRCIRHYSRLCYLLKVLCSVYWCVTHVCTWYSCYSNNKLTYYDARSSSRRYRSTTARTSGAKTSKRCSERPASTTRSQHSSSQTRRSRKSLSLKTSTLCSTPPKSPTCSLLKRKRKWWKWVIDKYGGFYIYSGNLYILFIISLYFMIHTSFFYLSPQCLQRCPWSHTNQAWQLKRVSRLFVARTSKAEHTLITVVK